MPDFKNMEIDPLSLMETLKDEAIHLVKMDIETAQEVTLYEHGINLTAKAWEMTTFQGLPAFLH